MSEHETDKLTLRMTLEITFNLHGTHPADLYDNLYDTVHHAYANGMITGDTDAEIVVGLESGIEAYKLNIEKVK